MEVVILGLWEDIQKHMPMEIWLYLLVFAVLLSGLGKQIYSRRSSFSYMRQIRYGTTKKWWRRCCVRVIGSSMAAVTALFLFSGVICLIQKKTGSEWGWAFLLWQSGFLLIGLIQMVLIYLPGGVKWSFLLLMGLETLSLVIPALPGSLLMFRRSGLAGSGGFSPVAALAGEWILSGILVLAGHNVVKWSQGDRRFIKTKGR